MESQVLQQATAKNKDQLTSDLFDCVQFRGRICEIDEIQTLIKKGADVNAKDIDDYTPLDMAVMNDHADICECLIENGADIHAKDTCGYTPPYLGSKKRQC